MGFHVRLAFELLVQKPGEPQQEPQHLKLLLHVRERYATALYIDPVAL
jgi:hypothetical protein